MEFLCVGPQYTEFILGNLIGKIAEDIAKVRYC